MRKNWHAGRSSKKMSESGVARFPFSLDANAVLIRSLRAPQEKAGR
jgi:hypothetical protein